MKRRNNATIKMQLLWECHNHKWIIRIPTLSIQKEVLCTMPQVPTHKQLPHQIMACTWYHRPNRERNQQKTKMVKNIMTETKTILLKDLVEQKRKQYGWPHLRHSPTMDTIQKIPDTYWKEQHDNGKTLKQV